MTAFSIKLRSNGSLICIAFLMICLNSQQFAGQTAKIVDEKLRVILQDSKTNTKYRLTVLFYVDQKAEAVYLKIRDDKTGRESSLPYLLSGEDSTEIWSPNEEFLLLANIYVPAVYRAADVAKIFTSENFDPDLFYDQLKSLDKISLETKTYGLNLRHIFIEWKNNESFIFKVNIEAETVREDTEIGDFRYDFVKKKLYLRARENSEVLQQSQNRVKLYKIFGSNSKKKIRGAAIENDLLQ